MFSYCLPSQVTVAGRTFSITKATKNDVRPIAELLTDDVLGAGREGWQENAEAYERAFDLIEASPDNALLTVREARGASSEESDESEPVPLAGTFQLTFLPGLSRKGMSRLQVEAVRVAEDYQSMGLGSALMRWAIECARQSGCGLVQLTTDKTRVGAHRFYDRLGFEATHEGYKIIL